MARYVAIDIETSGLRPLYHEILEVGIVSEHPETDDTVSIEFSLPMRYPLQADPKALEVNRWGQRMFAPRWTIEAAADCLVRTLEGAHLIGKNPSFDAAFLETFLHRHAGQFKGPIWHHRLVDVGMLAWGWYSSRRIRQSPSDWQQYPPNSERVAELVGVPLPLTRHTALADAEWAYDVFRKIVPR